MSHKHKTMHVFKLHGFIPYLHKVGVLGIPDRHHSMHFLDQLLFLIIIKLHVPFGQSCFPCSVLDEDEADLCDTIEREKTKHKMTK